MEVENSGLKQAAGFLRVCSQYLSWLDKWKAGLQLAVKPSEIGLQGTDEKKQLAADPVFRPGFELAR